MAPPGWCHELETLAWREKVIWLIPAGWTEWGGEWDETGPSAVPCTMRKGSIPLAAKPEGQTLCLQCRVAEPGEIMSPLRGTGDIAWEDAEQIWEMQSC